MKGQKKKQNGITLIALVISIIVMLILAGVSLNMTIGDNGIIKQAQAATYAQSIAYLQEQVNYDNVQKEKNELSSNNLLEDYIRDGYVARFLSSGADNTIVIRYVFLKENLPEEWKKNIVGGEGLYTTLKDVYGVNSDLTVWYLDEDGNTVGKDPENLALNENEHIGFKDTGFTSVISNITGKEGEDITVGDIENITELILSDVNVDNLDDLYYMPNIKKLNLTNVHLRNVNGVVYAQNIQSVYISGTTTIDDWSHFSSLSNCTTFDIYYTNNITDAIFKNQVVPGISGMMNLKFLYIRGQESLTNVDCMDTMRNKNSILTIYFDGCKGIKNINGIRNFNGLTRLDFVNANNLESLEPISTKTNMWRIQCEDSKVTDISFIKNFSKLEQFCFKGTQISDFSGFSDLATYNNITYFANQNNTQIDTSTLSSLSWLYKKLGSTSFLINDSYKKYLFSNTDTNIDLSSNNLTDLSILSTYPNATTVKLLSNPLTDTSLAYFKTNTNSKITELYLDGSNITNLDWLVTASGTCTLPQLRKLSLYNCDSLTSLKNLSKCTLLTDLDIGNCDALVSTSLYETSGTSKTYYLPSSITRLYLRSSSKLASLEGIANLTGLKWIDFSHTKVSGENANTLNNITTIKSMYFGNDGNASNNVNMASLVPTINRVTDWLGPQGNFAGELAKQCNLSTIKVLRFESGNYTYRMYGSQASNSVYNIDELDLSNCTNLETFRLVSRNVKKLKLPQSMPSLKSININVLQAGYKLDLPNFSNSTLLNSIYLDNCNLSNADLDTLCGYLKNKTNLTSLSLQGNTFSKLDKIADVGSSTSTNNIALYLNNNIISDINGLKTMSNNIASIDFTNNKISNASALIELSTNNASKRLSAITITGNNISESQRNQLKKIYTVTEE